MNRTEISFTRGEDPGDYYALENFSLDPKLVAFLKSRGLHSLRTAIPYFANRPAEDMALERALKLLGFNRERLANKLYSLITGDELIDLLRSTKVI